MNQPVPRTSLEMADQVDIAHLVKRVLVRWPILAVFVLLTSAAALLILRGAIYTYTAELKLTPVESNSPGSMSLGQLRGLASFAGVSLPANQEATPFFLYVESVTSRAVADELAKDTDLMKIVFKKEWNEQANRFANPTPQVTWVDKLKELIGIPSYPWSPPGGARLQLYLQDNVDVEEDSRKPIVTLTFQHEDPEFAVAFLAALNRTIDNQLRQRTLTKVNDNIAFLSQQLQIITLAEHRQAIIEALSEQLRTKMAASSKAPIAAEIVSGPTSSFRPTQPRPYLILGGAAGVGLLLGIMAALALEWLLSPAITVARVPEMLQPNITVARVS